MKKVQNVAVITDGYRFNDGCASVLLSYTQRLNDNGYSTHLICQDGLPGSEYSGSKFQISSISGWVVFLNKYKIDVVQYVRAHPPTLKSTVLSKIIRAKHKVGCDFKVIITLLQKPSFPSAILTPFEIENSDLIIFIDKSAYNDNLYRFIPAEKKKMTYLKADKSQFVNNEIDKFAKKDYSIKSDTIVFGRGSSLTKCPKDVIDIYDKIHISKNKSFIIVGIPDKPNWLNRLIKNREKDDIFIMPNQQYLKYVEIVSKFDIMLYYLSPKAYSSIDGSLRAAQRLGVPSVIYGPAAVKEPYTHGENGLIAETKEEFVKYAEMLAENEELREKIGRNARETLISEAPDINWRDCHIQLMEEVFQKQEKCSFRVPFLSYCKIYFIKYTARCSRILKRGFDSIVNTFFTLKSDFL